MVINACSDSLMRQFLTQEDKADLSFIVPVLLESLFCRFCRLNKFHLCGSNSDQMCAIHGFCTLASRVVYFSMDSPPPSSGFCFYSCFCHVPCVLQEVQASGNAVPSGEPDEERGGAGGVVATGSRGGGATGTGPSKTRSATLPSSVAGASVETNASSKDGQLKEPSIYGKGMSIMPRYVLINPQCTCI